MDHIRPRDLRLSASASSHPNRRVPLGGSLCAILIALATLAAPSAARGDLPYPRLFTTLWNSPEPKDFEPASKFDAVEFFWTDIVGTPGYVDSVRAMKARNPNLKVIGVVWCNVNCTNWDPREIVMYRWSEQMAAHDYWWYLRDVDGDYFKTLAESSCAEGYMNWTRTDMAEAFAQYVHEEMFLAYPGVFDGVHFDVLVGGISWIQANLWTEGGIDSIDANRDGQADLPDSLDARWARGVNAFCQRLRSLANGSYTLVVNGGVPRDSFQYMNGRFHEGFPAAIGGLPPDWFRGMLDPWIGYLNEPELYNDSPEHIFPLQGLSYEPYDCDPQRLATTEEPYDPACCQSMMRLTVASSLLGDGYACFTGWARRSVGGDAVNYHSTWWFPLYDSLRVNLGTPLGAAYDSSTIVPLQKDYKRYFTNGTIRITHTFGLPLPDYLSMDLRPKAVFRQSPTFLPWVVGTEKTIRFRGWDPMGETAFLKVRLLLSRNGGASFPETLAVRNATDSLATFVVAGLASANCRLRVETRDFGGYKGWSDSGPFAILTSSNASGLAEVLPDTIQAGRIAQASLYARITSAPASGIREVTIVRPSVISFWTPTIVTVNDGLFIGNVLSLGDSIRVIPTIPWPVGTRVRVRLTAVATSDADPVGAPVVVRLVANTTPVQRVAALPGDANGVVGDGENLTVVVEPGPAVRIIVLPASATIPAGGGRIFFAAGRDEYENVVPLLASWSVLGGIGSITHGGIFTAGAPGVGAIVASAATFSDTAEVIVLGGSAGRIEILPDSLTFTRGTDAQFSATIYDSLGHIVPGSIIWSVTGPATLVAPGRLHGAATGIGFITARSGTLADSSWYRVRGNGGSSTGTPSIPGSIDGLAVWPQPVPRGSTAQIAFTLPSEASAHVVGDIDIGVYDAQGRLVTRLTPPASLVPGATALLSWDGRDDAGRAIASGVYVVRASAPSLGMRFERKLVVVR